MPQRSMQAKLRVVWTSGVADPADVASEWAAALEDGNVVPAAGVTAIRPEPGPERTATLLMLVQGAATPNEGLALASRRAARVLGGDPRVSEIRAVAAWPVP
ncbi:MAG TPA: hypothetical protein VKT83_05205 [bacterium]|nr:hypothetical protein [bacterium]